MNAENFIFHESLIEFGKHIDYRQRKVIDSHISWRFFIGHVITLYFSKSVQKKCQASAMHHYKGFLVRIEMRDDQFSVQSESKKLHKMGNW